MLIGIIGGGPAGYSAALRLSEKGNKIYLFEKEQVGGVCLNIGCIPTKALVYSANLYNSLKSKTRDTDWKKIQENKNLAVKRAILGLKNLLKEKEIEIIKAEAVLKKDGLVKAKGNEYKFDKLILATGSKPIKPHFTVPADVWYSKDALKAQELPDSIVIIGAGYIGLEFAYIFSCLGCKVSVIEKENEILPGEDIESATLLRKSFVKQGIKVYLSSEVIEVKKEKDNFEVFFNNENKEEKIESKKVLIAIGRIPNIDNLPEEILDNKRTIKVNSSHETIIENIFAIGDCTGGYLLAHSAFKNAEILARGILGEKTDKEKSVVPRVVYTHPELAFVGFSEEKAQTECMDYIISKVLYAANGRAIATGKTRGQIKLICTKEGKIIGSAIVGESASELISLISLAMDNELGLGKLSKTVFPHPTFSEIIGEAVTQVKQK